MDEPGGEPRTLAGRYRLVEPIGRGGMGVVWRAVDTLLDREAAVKEVQVPNVLPRSEREEMYRRTLREARSAARLRHPNVVTLFDVVDEDERPWIVMDLIDARSLDQMVGRDGPLPPGRAARIGRQVLAALTAAHAAGVLHRDVKPGNVLVGRDDRVTLTDFGIATIEGDASITASGQLVGSPGYLGPERALGETATAASDLWALGATLFMAVEGHGPYDRPTAMATLGAVLTQDPPPCPHAGPLTQVIEGLLVRDPAARMTAPQATGLLDAISGGTAPTPPSDGAAGAAAAGAALGATAPLGPDDHAGGADGAPGRPRAAGEPDDQSTAVVPAMPPAGVGGPRQDATLVAGPENTMAAPPPGSYRRPPGPYGQPPGSYGPAPNGAGGPRPPYPPYGGDASRRRVWMGVLFAGVGVVVVVALAGGVLWALNQGSDGGGGVRPAGTVTPSAHPTTPATPLIKKKKPKHTPRSIPAGFTRRSDGAGFSVALPDGWGDRKAGPNSVTYFSPDHSSYLLIDRTQQPTNDPMTNIRRFSSDARRDGKYRGAQTLRMGPIRYLGRKAAVWEFTWVMDGGRRAHAEDRQVLLADGRPIAVYWQSPDSRWAATERARTVAFSSLRIR